MPVLTTEEYEKILKDAERYRYLRDNNIVLRENVTEMRGIRGTMVNSPREVWYEHEGWTLNNMSITVDPFETMDAAVDAGIEKEKNIGQ